MKAYVNLQTIPEYFFQDGFRTSLSVVRIVGKLLLRLLSLNVYRSHKQVLLHEFANR